MDLNFVAFFRKSNSANTVKLELSKAYTGYGLHNKWVGGGTLDLKTFETSSPLFKFLLTNSVTMEVVFFQSWSGLTNFCEEI